MSKEKKKCFIIAPLTTPEELAKAAGDENHCRHVIDCLLTPAVDRAGFEPVPPEMEGAEVIQAGIISRLQDADLVLCDMSGLNPNVFFELGIRTAQHKPVCLVRDDRTPRIPFDTSPITAHQYDSHLDAWIIESEIEKMRRHIEASAKEKDNTLWKYFGVRMGPTTGTPEGVEGKMDLVLLQIEALRKQLDPDPRALRIPEIVLPPEDRNSAVEDRRWIDAMMKKADNAGVPITISRNRALDRNLLVRIPEGRRSHAILRDLRSQALAGGYTLTFQDLLGHFR